MTIRRAPAVSTAFCRYLITIALIGVVTAMAGRMLGSLVGGAIIWLRQFFSVGLYLLDVIAMPFSPPVPKAFVEKASSRAAGAGLGALGPCTLRTCADAGDYVSPGGDGCGYGVLLLAMYGIGHCSVIVFAGTFSEVIQRYLNWNESSKGFVVLKRIWPARAVCGCICFILLTCETINPKP